MLFLIFSILFAQNISYPVKSSDIEVMKQEWLDQFHAEHPESDLQLNQINNYISEYNEQNQKILTVHDQNIQKQSQNFINTQNCTDEQISTLQTFLKNSSINKSQSPDYIATCENEYIFWQDVDGLVHSSTWEYDAFPHELIKNATYTIDITLASHEDSNMLLAALNEQDNISNFEIISSKNGVYTFIVTLKQGNPKSIAIWHSIEKISNMHYHAIFKIEE